MLDWFRDLPEWLAWLPAVARWLASPSVSPWAGAAAAVLAAMSLTPWQWIKRPREGLGRSVQVAAVWLLVAWLLSAAARGCGDGSGGQGQGAGEPPSRADLNGKAADSPAGKESGAARGEPELAFPSALPENVVLVVWFVPAAGQPQVAEDFRCRLLTRTQSVAVRAADMPDFEKQLFQELRRLALPEAVNDPVAYVERAPFPGEGVLRKVQQKVRTALPQVTVKFSESSP